MPVIKTQLTPQISFIPHAFRAVDVDARTAEFVISDASIDRHGTILSIDGWELANFGANGIVGYQHEVYASWEGKSDPDQVIGKGTVFIEGTQLIGKIEFEPEAINPLAEKILQKVDFGTLKATSVGFMPLEPGMFKDIEVAGHDGEKETKSIFHYGRRDLLEFSIVTIPSNANALQRAMDKIQEYNGLHTTTFEQITCGLKGENLGAFLNDEIEKLVTDDRSRTDIIEEMATEADIDEDTVNSILNGRIACPPVERLEAFARVLGASAASMISSAETDGCDYERKFQRPFEGEHACRLKDPKDFERFARENDAIEIGDKTADAIFGIKSDDSSELQSVRFDKDEFTEGEAKSWCDDHSGTFEAATEKKKKNSLQFAKKRLHLHEQES